MLWMLPNQMRSSCYWNLYRIDHCYPFRLVLLLVLERVHPLVVRPRLLVPPLPNLSWIKLRYFMVHHGHKHYKNYVVHLSDLGLGFSFLARMLEFDLLPMALQEGEILRWNG